MLQLSAARFTKILKVMRPFGRIFLVFFALNAFTACAAGGGRVGFQRSEIPLTFTDSMKAPVRHKMSVAILPILDRRPSKEGSDGAYRYSYRGKSYGFTDLRKLKRGFSSQMTSLLAKTLLRTGVFRQIILVDNVAQASGTDLILSGQIKRARGYVQQSVSQDQSAQKINPQRQVMSEFVMSDVTLRKTQTSTAVVFESDFGWSIFEKRQVADETEAAYRVLADTMSHAFGQLSAALKESDLSGAYTVTERVSYIAEPQPEGRFGQLARVGPKHWVVDTTVKTSTVPSGWQGQNVNCAQTTLRAQQTWRFHRVLGPYRPTVTIWRCPVSSSLDYNMRASQAAEYLGTDGTGEHFFLRALGETNWKSSREDIVKHLSISAPNDKYVFRIRPNES